LASDIFSRVAPVALLVLLAACGDAPPANPPRTDSFYFPTGIALRHVPAGCVGASPGCQTQLLVGSSNFDLRYDNANGGTVIAVDAKKAIDAAVAALAQNPSAKPAPLDTSNGLLGSARVGTFGGEVAVLDAETCSTFNDPPLPGQSPLRPQVLVASRSQNALYRVAIDDGAPAGSALSCGPECKVPLEPSLADPYGVTVACGNFPATFGAVPEPQAFAFVTYLRAPNAEGWLSKIDLLNGGARTQLDMGAAPTHSTVFDGPSTRLYATSRFAAVGYTPLRWITLATAPAPPPAVPSTAVNIFDLVRGAEMRGMAISSDRTRAYLALRIYDVTLATSAGARSATDIAGALAVMDLTDTAGRPTARILNVIPLDRGATEVRVVPRAGLPDLVAVTSTDDSTLTLYDDQSGSIAKVFEVCSATAASQTPDAPPPCDLGKPLLGKQPFGLAVEQIDGGLARLYVGSFDRSWVNVITIDPLHPAAPPKPWVRIGPERP
jgi:hypothetical protein